MAVQVYKERPDDKAYAPSRQVTRERFDRPTDLDASATPPSQRGQLNWKSKGETRATSGTGWVERNAKHISSMVYERTPLGTTQVRATGIHPSRGEFEYTVPLSERRDLQNKVAGARSKYDHIAVEDRTRGG